MRAIFAGTPEFARVALAQLHAAGFEIPLVLSQPDRPAGRGMKLHASAVKILALASGIPVFQPPSLKTPEAQAALDRHSRLEYMRGARITPARLGDRGPLVGAGAVGLRGVRRSSRAGVQ